MNNENQVKAGLWEKTSKNGNVYYNGKVTLDGKDYWVKMFDNSGKTNDKAPDYNLIFEEAEEQQQTSKVELPKNMSANPADLGWN